MILPPSGIAPERLFRLLLGTPRPSVQIKASICGKEISNLKVMALSGLEISNMLDFSRSEFDELTSVNQQNWLVLNTVYLGDERLFDSADDLSLLDSDEFFDLSNKVSEALGKCSPSYTISNTPAWSFQLALGAAHISNLAISYTLGSCVDITSAGKVMRPDRYFGLPFSQMTDGHWMAYRAAYRVAERNHA